LDSALSGTKLRIPALTGQQVRVPDPVMGNLFGTEDTRCLAARMEEMGICMGIKTEYLERFLRVEATMRQRGWETAGKMEPGTVADPTIPCAVCGKNPILQEKHIMEQI